MVGTVHERAFFPVFVELYELLSSQTVQEGNSPPRVHTLSPVPSLRLFLDRKLKYL